MKKGNGAVKEVIELASHIAELRAQLNGLKERIAEEEAALGELVAGRGAGRRAAPKRRAPAPPVPAKVRSGKAKRAKGKDGAVSNGRASVRSKSGNGRPARGAANGAGGTIMEAIVAALQARSADALSVGEVANAVGAKPTSVATMLKRLVERGQVKKPATGRYQAA